MTKLITYFSGFFGTLLNEVLSKAPQKLTKKILL